MGLFFGAIALLLSAVGLYGVSSHAANRGRVEIGIRLALGGQAHEVVGKMLRRLALLVSTGVLLGVLGSLGLVRFIKPLLFGLGPYEPIAIVVAILILAAVAAVAGWIPFSRGANRSREGLARGVIAPTRSRSGPSPTSAS